MTTHAPWDFDEYTNYNCYSIIHKNPHEKEDFVYIKRINNNEQEKQNATILAFLSVFTRYMQKHVNTKNQYKHNKCLQLFTKTEHVFYEIDRNFNFRGVNKPKNVHLCQHDKDRIGLDGLLRAHTRHVMIILPDNAKELYDLYCHEIAHTLCNHVQFRVDDHHGKSKMDFPYNEQLVKTISTELKLMNHLVKLYNEY